MSTSGMAGMKRARVTIGTGNGMRISPLLFGKFCEHLGSNIYHGMEAQILRNCTFGRWQFWGGECSLDGGVMGQCDQQKVLEQIRARAERDGVDPAAAKASYEAGLTYGWWTLGQTTRYSPDVAPAGGRAQRIEVTGGTGGIWQPVWLPLHRTRRLRYRLIARSAGAAEVELAIATEAGKVLCSAAYRLDEAWQTLEGEMELPADAAADVRYRFSVQAAGPANIVVARVTLYPGDAVEGQFDPEIIGLLREAKLPLLRWPGGNFVSGYHWRDGVGPIDLRPTKPNPAWEGLEFNTFGTVEFVRFCRAVGCEPMICVNAGNGSAEEAADWVEYCNGGLDTPMGRLRAQHGYPEPFGIRYWEVGNELWGKWQVGHTTPAGNADRFRRFAAAMRKADATIELIATGPQCKMDQEWTHTLIAQGGPELKTMTDHILAWAEVGAADDPWDVFQGYAGHAIDGARQYRWLKEQMEKAGIASPQLAITEMQVFPSWKDGGTGAMTREQLVRPNTLAEAVYFITWLAECVRLGGFVQMITHSATVNHGGGLSKQREHAWGHPVHHAHVLAAPLQNAEVLPVTIESGTYSTQRSYGFVPKMEGVAEIEAVAGQSSDGRRVVLLANRARQAVKITLEMADVGRGEACVDLLQAEVPWASNSLENRDRVSVQRGQTLRMVDGKVDLEMAAASVVRVTIAR